MIEAAEASKQHRINEAEGAASAIRAIAEATAQGIRVVAQAIQLPGGFEAAQLRVAEQYIESLGHLAAQNNTMILPSNLPECSSSAWS